MFFQGFLKYLEVFSFQYSCVFFYFFEIRIDTPLSDFVADSRHIFPDNVGKVKVSTGLLCVDDTVHTFSPTLDAWFHRIPIVGVFNIRPATGTCIDAAEVF